MTHSIDPQRCRKCGNEELTQTPIKHIHENGKIIVFGVSEVICRKCDYKSTYYYNLRSII